MTAPEDQNGLRGALVDKRNTEEFAMRSEAPGDPWEMVRHLEEQCRIFIRERNEWKAVADRELGLLRAAEAEITRLKEGLEAAVGALGLALRFVDRAAGEGLSFDADGDQPAMDAADVCFAVAEALGIEDLDSEAYRALVACPDFATLSQEQP